jgi:glyceraldehyde 3-phosphate dehydrogenase
MRKIRIGINGFGRIGRAIYRINHQKKLFDIVAVNDINPDIKNMVYLLQYDTTYGRFSENVEHNDNQIFVGSDSIQVYHEGKILNVPWGKHDIDIVIDSSGIKSNLSPMLKDKSSIKNFIITNSPSGFDQIKTIIFGVNEKQCDPNKNKVFSASICDTIALAPIINLIQSTHNIETGFLVTLHPWLTYQNLLDGPSASWSQPGDVFSHYALGRASTENLIPKSTSAIIAADHVCPGLSGKIQSFSYRTPTKIVSSAVLILLLAESINKSQLQDMFQEYEETQEYKVIHNSIEPLTSLDYCGEEYSAIIDQRWTKVENCKHIKLVYWYDNEWGYSCRVVDLVKEISRYYS